MEKHGWLDGNPALYPYEGDPGMKGKCSAYGFYQREFVLPSSVANFMRGQRSSEGAGLPKVYTMRSGKSDQHWGGARKVQ